MDFGDALKAAGSRTNHLLFRRGSRTRWRNFALLTFLTGGSAGGGFGFHYSPTVSGHTSARPHANLAASADPHTMLLIVGGVLVLALVICALAVLYSWFGAIARLVMIENIVYDREAILEPVGRLRRLGTSYFWFTLAWGCAALLPTLLILGGALSLFAPHLAEELKRGNFSSLILLLGLSLLIVLPLGLLIGAFGVFCDELVVPVMYREDLKAVPALKLVFGLVRRNPGEWFLFWMVHAMISGIGAMLTLTCVITAAAVAGILLCLTSIFPALVVGAGAGAAAGWSTAAALFFLGLVVLLPFFVCAWVPLVVFKRCFSIYCLQSFDPHLEMLPANGRNVLDQGGNLDGLVAAPAPLQERISDHDGGWTPASEWKFRRPALAAEPRPKMVGGAMAPGLSRGYPGRWLPIGPRALARSVAGRAFFLVRPTGLDTRRSLLRRLALEGSPEPSQADPDPLRTWAPGARRACWRSRSGDRPGAGP
jgi:hypothetical protein